MNHEKPKLNIQIIDEGEKKTDKEASDYLENFASFKNENELEKDSQFIKFFTKAKEIVTELANNYGAKPLNIKLEMLHLLPHEDFIKENDKQMHAFYLYGGIYIDEQWYKKWDELTKLMVFCHELIHASSYQKIIRSRKNEKEVRVKDLRSGLKVNLNEVDFKGLNEGMTEFLTNVCYFNNVKDKIGFPVAAPPLEIENSISKMRFDSYKSFENLFNDLCKKIAETNANFYKDERPVVREFIKIYFNGGMVGMAKLTMSLGKGALNSLAKINDLADEENLMRIVNFRKKYGLSEDVELNKYVESLKK